MKEAGLSAHVIDSKGAATLMESLTDLVIRAGTAILAVDRHRMQVGGKTDGTPVTEADHAADRVIAEGLAQLAPAIPTVSEEHTLRTTAAYRGSFFLIDPLD